MRGRSSSLRRRACTLELESRFSYTFLLFPRTTLSLSLSLSLSPPQRRQAASGGAKGFTVPAGTQMKITVRNERAQQRQQRPRPRPQRQQQRSRGTPAIRLL